MDIELTIKNYRCFPDDEPARIEIKDGFTAFVGVNNAGKSSLLQFFYIFRRLFQNLQHNDLVGLLQLDGRQPIYQVTDTNPDEIFCNKNNRDLEFQIRWHPVNDGSQQVSVFDLRLSIKIPRSLQSTSLSSTFYFEKKILKVDDIIALNNTRFKHEDVVFDTSPLKEAFTVFARMLYIGPFRNVINVLSGGNYFDISVGQAFIAQWSTWLTGGSPQDNEAAYQVVKQLGKIFELPDLQINPSNNKDRLLMLIDGKSNKLDQFGTGMTQFFLVLAHAAMRRPSFILIDEPELNLHPALQVDFLTTLASYTSNGILFATHTIGLARAIGNRIYSVHRETDGRSRVMPYESTPRLAEFLGELSFAGYKELGFDKILLVEGTTEVTTIQQFLRQLSKDHQVVLLPMGGGQMINAEVGIQLEEIKRITPNIFALIDSERASPNAPLEKTRAEFVGLCKEFNIVCHVLELRAIENYFLEHAVQKVKGPKYRALQPYEPLDQAPLGWAKSDNWRMAREMSRTELGNTDLGKFLMSI